MSSVSGSNPQFRSLVAAEGLRVPNFVSDIHQDLIWTAARIVIRRQLPPNATMFESDILNATYARSQYNRDNGFNFLNRTSPADQDGYKPALSDLEFDGLLVLNRHRIPWHDPNSPVDSLLPSPSRRARPKSRSVMLSGLGWQIAAQTSRRALDDPEFTNHHRRASAKRIYEFGGRAVVRHFSGVERLVDPKPL